MATTPYWVQIPLSHLGHSPNWWKRTPPIVMQHLAIGDLPPGLTSPLVDRFLIG